LIGFPVAFSLMAAGLFFAGIAIAENFFGMPFLQAIPQRIFGSVLANDLLLAIHRGRLYIDLFGLIVFLMPACILFTWLSWTTLFYPSWLVSEHSLNAGGLSRYPIKFVVPFGFFMLSLQGLSEIIKRVGALNGEVTLPAADLHYEKPMQ